MAYRGLIAVVFVVMVSCYIMLDHIWCILMLYHPESIRDKRHWYKMAMCIAHCILHYVVPYVHPHHIAAVLRKICDSKLFVCWRPVSGQPSTINQLWLQCTQLLEFVFCSCFQNHDLTSKDGLVKWVYGVHKGWSQGQAASSFNGIQKPKATLIWVARGADRCCDFVGVSLDVDCSEAWYHNNNVMLWQFNIRTLS